MITIATLLKSLYTDWRVNGRKSISTMAVHARQVEQYFGKMDANKLKQVDIRAYVVQRKDAGLANATINRELSVLSKAYSLALEAEEIEKAPVFRRLPEQNVRQGTYTRAEVDAIMAQLPEHYRPVMLYAYLTGRRKGEIVQLRWDDVDLKRRIVTVRQSTNKAGVPDTVPLEGELYELLLNLWEVHRDNCPWVFNRRGQPIGDFHATFIRARERAGLPDRLFHDLRRTFATDAIEAGIPESVVMRQTGHKTQSMLQRYNIVRPQAVRQGMLDIEAHRKTLQAEGGL